MSFWTMHAASFLRRPARNISLAAASLPLLFCGIAALHGLIDSRFRQHEQSLFLLDRKGDFIAAVENGRGEFGYWTMPDSLPNTIVAATLAAEDRRFHHHPGFDIRAIGRAFVDNYIRQRGYSGASTIAMQVARLQRGGGSGWYKKVHDAVCGCALTLVYGRERVLRHYLTIAPYGNRMAGAACAARRYFHKPVQDLSFAEAALLAAIPKAPSRMNLYSDRGFLRAARRARLIINRAALYGWMSGQERSEALAELATFTMPTKEWRDESCFHFIRACPRRLTLAPSAGGEIRTTLDLDIQDTVLLKLKRAYPWLIEKDASSAAGMVVDVRTGEVLAYVGSIDYYDHAGGAIDCADLPRSTGSLLKPFIYAQGMEWLGYTPATVLTDVGFDFGAGPRSFIPENCDRKFLGPVLYKCALANSRNIPAVQVLKALGVERFYSTCAALGLTRDDGKAEYYGLGLSIGGLYCTLQELSAAYLTLANQGKKSGLVWEMNAPSQKDGTARQVITPEVALQIRRFLSDPVARLPTFPRGGNLEYPFAVAVKTGTSEGFRDSWCIAWSDRYLVAVWAGNPDFSSTREMSGFSGAAPIVKSIMLSLHPGRKGGLEDIEFPPPPGYIPISLCRLSGKLADRSTPYVTTDYFKPGTEPLEVSTVQQLIPIDPANGLRAVPGPAARVEYRRFIVVPPEFTDWAVAQGLEVPPDRYSPACTGAPIINTYDIAVTNPRDKSRIFIDPEMPEGKSALHVGCRVVPRPSSVLWFVNGEEAGIARFPFKLRWPLKKGAYTFQAAVPHTPFKSAPISIEVF
jgi:penicillin-binding protein 1C